MRNTSKTKKKRTGWQLPPGVSGGTWDYCQSPAIAETYDDYLGQHGLFRLDETTLQRHVRPGENAIDLGCGTGRAILPLLQRGIPCVAVDLSQHMLDQVQAKAQSAGHSTPWMCVRANLVDLGCFADGSFDAALCLFSTLGMIRTTASRKTVVRHAARILRPGGRFILQVHNYWVQLFDPGGPWSMLHNAWQRVTRDDIERGDRFYPYRGIPDMYLHSFTAWELRRLLHGAGFRIREWLPLNARQDDLLRLPWLANSLRASGWIVVAEK